MSASRSDDRGLLPEPRDWTVELQVTVTARTADEALHIAIIAIDSHKAEIGGTVRIYPEPEVAGA